MTILTYGLVRLLGRPYPHKHLNSLGVLLAHFEYIQFELLIYKHK